MKTENYPQDAKVFIGENYNGFGITILTIYNEEKFKYQVTVQIIGD